MAASSVVAVHFRTMGPALLLSALMLGSAASAQFETRATFSLAGAEPYSLVVGDFNRDGILDVAIPSASSAEVQILLGNGDGTFRRGATYSVGSAFHAATASLRNNGILDIVLGAANNDYVYVMLGNGDGTFEPAVGYLTTAASKMIGLGDFTGDGRIDIFNLEGSSDLGVICNCVEVLPGNGDGTFGPPVTTPMPYGITGFAIADGDFNDDGKLDVAVGGEFFSASQVDILLGNGDGSFSPEGLQPATSLQIRRSWTWR